MFMKEKYSDSEQTLFKDYDPYKSNAIVSHDISAILKYAKENGKRVSDLTKDEINVFRIGKKETA